jgi:hypothetical protein
VVEDADLVLGRLYALVQKAPPGPFLVDLRDVLRSCDPGGQSEIPADASSAAEGAAASGEEQPT